MATFRVAEILFSSNGTCVWFHGSATSDALIPTPSLITEQVMFGPNFADDPRWLKTVKEVRLDLRANTASVVSVGLTMNGSTLSENKSISLSAGSQFAQSALTFDTEGRYPQVHLQSRDGGSWRLPRFYVMAERQGR